MNKRQYTFMIRNELSKLNRQIDNKILMGYPYEHDAKRHKMLLMTLTKIARRERFNRFAQNLVGVVGNGRMIARLGFTLF